MNKSSLVRDVARRTGIEPATVAAVVDAVLDTIRDTVSRGSRVVLSGFGTFERVRRNARTGRNPRTGDTVGIPARNVPTFRPGTRFRDAVMAAGRGTGKRRPTAKRAASRGR